MQRATLEVLDTWDRPQYIKIDGNFHPFENKHATLRNLGYPSLYPWGRCDKQASNVMGPEEVSMYAEKMESQTLFTFLRATV
jgi:hypothetical protein